MRRAPGNSNLTPAGTPSRRQCLPHEIGKTPFRSAHTLRFRLSQSSRRPRPRERPQSGFAEETRTWKVRKGARTAKAQVLQNSHDQDLEAHRGEDRVAFPKARSPDPSGESRRAPKDIHPDGAGPVHERLNILPRSVAPEKAADSAPHPGNPGPRIAFAARLRRWHVRRNLTACPSSLTVGGLAGGSHSPSSTPSPFVSSLPEIKSPTNP